MSKVTLKLDESNDLNFQFKVQGTSSEPGSNSPQFRFVVFEKERQEGMGFIFPVTAKESDGTITVSIPVLKGIFKEKQLYIGKVEVIIGTRLLVPTTLELEFVQSLAVEVTPILDDSTPKVDDRESIEDLLPELEGGDEPEKSRGLAAPLEGKKKITLTKSKLQALLLERRKKNQELQSKTQVKDSLKSLMKSALSEED